MGRDLVKKTYSLEQVFTDELLDIVLKQCVKDADCEVIDSEVWPASDGISGFLGDHIKMVLHVKVANEVKKVPLFVKRVPQDNQPKADFIDEHNFYRREKLMFELIKEMRGAEGPHPWCAESYLFSDTMLVMPDLTAQGYTIRPQLETLDLPHVLLTIGSIARFHAAFFNYVTNKSTNRPYNFYNHYGHLLQEPTFKDSPWLRAAAKLSADFLDAFSAKYNKTTIPDLENKLAQLYIVASDSLHIEEDSINVLIHKDLWINNILFQYKDGVPTNCLLIDFQCIRYGPPTFDILIFLYVNTTRSFREKHEREIFDHYYKVFSENITERSKKQIDLLGYDKKEFLTWCERSRMFGVIEAIGIYPFCLMDAKTAQRVFDDPDTYKTVIEHDRSSPVIEHARQCPAYKDRQLEVTEEFVERYVLNCC